MSAVEVWEDAVDRGYATRQPVQGRTIVVTTELGQQFLREHGRRAARSPNKPRR